MAHTGNTLFNACVYASNEIERYHGHAEGQIQDGLYGPIVIQ